MTVHYLPQRVGDLECGSCGNDNWLLNGIVSLTETGVVKRWSGELMCSVCGHELERL